MARGESLYARLDVDFWRSLDFQALPCEVRVLYISLWCYSLERRMDILPKPTDEQLRTLAGLKGKPVSKYMQLLYNFHTTSGKLGLIVDMETYIRIRGIRKKHKQFQWHDSPIIPQTLPNHSPNAPILTERNGTERNVTELIKERDSSRSPKKRTKSDKKPVNPDIKTFIDFYYQKHLEIIKSKLHIDGAKDGKLVGSMLTTFGLDELKTRAVKYLEDPKAWPGDDYSISRLKNQINKYIDKPDNRGGTNYDQYQST